MIEKVRLAEKFAQFSETWSPKIVGEVNDAHVKLVKLKGEFVWHHHEQEDELFLVISGHLAKFPSLRRRFLSRREGLLKKCVKFSQSLSKNRNRDYKL